MLEEHYSIVSAMYFYWLFLFVFGYFACFFSFTFFNFLSISCVMYSLLVLLSGFLGST